MDVTRLRIRFTTKDTMAKQQPASEESTPQESSKQQDSKTHGKKGPTPRRSDAQAANFRPLVPEDRKEAKRQANEKLRASQAEARAGMARGDDRYLRESDRGPQKRFMRDYIDSRFTLGELLVPMMFLVIIATFFPSTSAAFWAMGFIWVYLAVCVLEGILYGRIIRKKIADVVGPAKVEKGFYFASVGRSMQMRFLRMPKPQVKRFSKVEFTGR
ncbi:DUF3043 domain-containing protein [Gulosibacter molinativorax]|uniref:DUF3043 domain-containing protein n=2 Tax=Gulosibacter molinativorax TaxID=256821 RepID=A0ABT7C5D6_9MICO|nr:DUF3043 domain-containing protein [Gulosibacter molinativorax]